MFFTILIVLYVIVCFLLMLIILLQSGKGGGLSGAFGGGSTTTALGGSGGSGVIGKITWWLCAGFMVFSLAIARFAPVRSVVEDHAKEKAAAAAPIILNVVLIGSLFFSQWMEQSNVLVLSYAVSVAGFLQLAILFFYVRKNFKPILGIKIKIDKKIKFFFSKLLPSIFSSGVTQINILVGTIIASFQAGAVSYLYYADRVYQINLAVAGIAVGTVMLPELSKQVKKNNSKQITNLQNRALDDEARGGQCPLCGGEHGAGLPPSRE